MDILLIIITLMCTSLCIAVFYLNYKMKKLNQKLEKVIKYYAKSQVRK